MANNLEIKTDLLKVPGARYVKIKGEPHIIIATRNNPCIYVGTKGVYLTEVAIARKEVKDGQTHFLKPNFDSDVFQKMSKEAKDAIPIIGSVKELVKKGSAIEQNAVELTSEEVEVKDDFPF